MAVSCSLSLMHVLPLKRVSQLRADIRIRLPRGVILMPIGNSGGPLEAAHDRLRQQSEMLDKAQDAIFVQDMESRILYWNQGAERLYDWTAAQVKGQRVTDLFQASAQDVRRAFSLVVENG